MKVKLKVLHGSNAGREVKVPVAEFVIGRKEGCHLRPRSDLISRKHCVIEISESVVKVRDLKSRNGTFVNGERLEGEIELTLGDRLKVGKIEFEVLIDHGLGGNKKPVVKDVKEAVARVAQKKPGEKPESDISSWLEEADEIDREQRMTDPDTRQYKLGETERVTMDRPLTKEEQEELEAPEVPSADTISGGDADTTDDTKIEKKKKKEFGKLPKAEGPQSKDSCDAAAQVLRDFFNRR